MPSSLSMSFWLFLLRVIFLLLLSLDAYNHVDDYSGTLGGVRNNNNKSPLFSSGHSDVWKILVRAGASSSASSLNTLGLMPSGPPALYGLRSSISFFTHCSDILISSIAGMPLSAIPVLSSNSSAVYCLPSPKTD